MKPIIRNILLGTLTALVAGGVIACMIWLGIRKHDPIYKQLTIRITDLDEREYLTIQDVEGYILHAGFNPKNKPVSEVDLQAIENAVRNHPLVRKAECYTTWQGDVVVVLTQRIPMLRVLTATESYFIDSDRTRMPILPSVKTSVMLVQGRVGERMAQEELFDLTMWINKHQFFQQRIQSIIVEEGKQIVLQQKGDAPRIRLGALDGYRTKLKKVRTFIEHTPEEMNLPPYKELDVQYDNQVVGRK